MKARRQRGLQCRPSKGRLGLGGMRAEGRYGRNTTQVQECKHGSRESYWRVEGCGLHVDMVGVRNQTNGDGYMQAVAVVSSSRKVAEPGAAVSRLGTSMAGCVWPAQQS